MNLHNITSSSLNWQDSAFQLILSSRPRNPSRICRNETVEDMHNKKSFEMNALTTLKQAVAILYESTSFEDVLKNCFYVGGESDTLACVACNLASSYYAISNKLQNIAMNSLTDNKELYELTLHFIEHQHNSLFMEK